MNADHQSILHDLRCLLEKREAVVGDSELRTSAPELHLEALKQISEKVLQFHRDHAASLSPKLNHFLQNGSYSKAITALREQP